MYRVRHKTLGVVRVMKIVRATDETREQIKNEAKILSGLRDPGIPALYDAGEDKENVCLIEEYIPGVSLARFISEHRFSEKEICSIIEQTCDILTVMHKDPKGPVVYLDLKPEHLIMHGRRLCLIDYGSARRMPQSGKNPNPQCLVYGTNGYSAPECLTGRGIGPKCDIYSLSMLAEELFSHCETKMPPKTAALLRCAGCPDPDERPESAELFKEQWLKSIPQEKRKGCLFSNVAVIGAAPAAGATHVAIALTVYLNHTKRRAYYVNRSGVPVTRYLIENLKALSIGEYGLLNHADFMALPDRGSAANEDPAPVGIRVTDCGTCISHAIDSDIIIYVVGSCPWRECALPKDAILGKGTAVILNPGTRGQGIEMSKALGQKVWGFPSGDDAFVRTREKDRFFESLEQELV